MVDLPVPGLSAGDRARLAGVLHESRALGFLGPGPVGEQIDRSLALAPVMLALRPNGQQRGAPRALDLGSGGGLPGLVLAMAIPDWEWVLLDGSVKRTGFLSGAVEDLSLGDRVRVAATRAEAAGRGSLRSTLDLVVARGFAAAAPTAECAAPLLRIGGAAIVTEPPGGAPDRWPAQELDRLGLHAESRQVAPVALQVLRQVGPCPERFARRNGIPVKRPLWPEPAR